MSSIARRDVGYWQDADADYLGSLNPDSTKLEGVSSTLSELQSRLTAISQRWRDAAAFQKEDESSRFQRLVVEWKEATAWVSSIEEAVRDQRYMQIVGMGPIAVGFILAELERDPDYWFPALRAITGIDPVKPSQRGDLELMTRVWLQWGRSAGLV